MVNPEVYARHRHQDRIKEAQQDVCEQQQQLLQQQV